MTSASAWAWGAAWAVLLVVPTARPVLGQAGAAYENLQVLPADISREELGAIMLENLRGLGLTRRSGEGCLYCHAGSTDTPRRTWDYASDEKPAKAKARVMMSMVHEINSRFLSQLEDRVAPELEVGCYTCHAGRTNPTPLPDLLFTQYGDGGIEALVQTYHAARARYYEADTYDFRIGTLVGVANRLTEIGAFEDAAAVHEMNIEYYEAPQAYGGLIQLRLLQALDERGPDAMIERYFELKNELPPDAFIASAIDPLSWRLFRSDRQEPALQLFELNYAEHPASFIAMESLAYAVSATGDLERGRGLAEGWIREHPDHRGGLQLLAELRR